MRLPSMISFSIDVFHMPASGTQTYPVSADDTVTGWAVPLGRRDLAFEGGEFGEEMRDVFFSDSEDIRINDKLTFDGKTWYVKKINTYSFGSLRHLHAVCSRLFQ